MRTLVLDNEAIGALRDRFHPHHRAAMALYEANRSTRRRDPSRRTIVPTAVRAEAGWDRTDVDASFLNRLKIVDVPLAGRAVDVTARLVRDHGVSIADGHLGATVDGSADDDLTVATSDPGDIALVAGPHRVRIFTL